ncbi:MAG: hypothetical protein ABR520_02215 [Mycobacteriales bacterium]|nr:hypothetical protein [Frankia sp.]
MRRRHLAAGVAASGLLFLAAAPNAAATPGAAGTGSAIDTLIVSPLAGVLAIAGGGVSLTPAAVPGSFTSSLTGGTITVSDLRLNTLGWYVTATYSANTTGGATALGGNNVEVSASSITGDAASGATGVSDQALTSPATVMTTGANTGAGVTAASTAYKVRIPTSAGPTNTYGATITYTVASMR